METEATTSERPESRLSSDSDSDSDAPSNKKTEWLATSRAKRATAGNRMKSMLAAEEPDDDLELLFAEDEDDQGFTDAGEDAGDEHMDSSSDDDEENNAGDDMEGEKELEKQAKEKKAAARKRKANDAIPAKFRKKVRIDPTASSATSTPATPTSTAPAPRPKKKSERASWLPSISDMPTRASSRQTTRLSKEQLHAQMEEREAKRLKQLEYMQKKAARLEASKKPPMTQEERLREAEIVEKRNSKSLNRWELAEKQREEERRAKLAALNQRTLKGPVITFWSGTREWNDTNAGKYVIMEEKPKKKRAPKEKATDKADKAEKTAEPTLPADGQPSTESKKVDIKTDGREGTNPKEGAPETTDQPMQDAPPIQPTKDEPAKEPQPEAQADSPMKGAEPLKATAEETKNNSPMKETPPEQPMSDAPSQNEKPVEAVPPLAAEVEKNSPRPAEEKTTEGPEVQVGALGVASPLGPPPPPPASGLAAPISAPESGSAASEPKASSVLAAPMLAPPTEAAPEQAVPSSPSTSSQAKLDVPDPLGAQKSAEGSMPAPAMPNTTNARLLPIPDEAMPSLNEKNPATSIPEPLENQPPAVSLPEASPAGNTAEPPKDQAHGPSQAEDQPAEKTESKTATRNAIVYQNFNENAMKDKNIQTQILFGRKMTRLAKPSAPPVCVITNHPARYRDPETGLPYHNAHAYREIRRLTRGEYRWSQLLGAWSGGGNSAAKGVPARFLDPTAKGPKQVAEEKRLAQEEEDKKKREAEEEEEARKKVEEDEKKDAAEKNKAIDGGKESADSEAKAPDVTTAAAVETTPSAAPTSGSEAKLEAKPEVQQEVQPEAPPELASKQEQQEQQAALA